MAVATAAPWPPPSTQTIRFFSFHVERFLPIVWSESALLPSPNMIVEKRSVDGFTILVVEGTIKLGESARFLADALKRVLADETGHVMVDLEGINQIDSTGVGELVGYLVRFQEQKRKLILIHPPARVMRLLEVANVVEMFPIYDDARAAVAAET